MWPSGTGTVADQMVGTTLFTDPNEQHSVNHRQLGSIANSLTTVLGTTGGTNLLQGVVSASDQIIIASSAGSIKQHLTGGVIDFIGAGTAFLTNPSITGGTMGSSLIQSPTINGQGTNSGTISGGMYGTGFVNGGSINVTVGTIATGTLGTLNVNVGTIGTLAGGSLTTGNFQTGQVLRLSDNTQNYKIQFGTLLGTLSGIQVSNVTFVFGVAFATKLVSVVANICSTASNPVSNYTTQPFNYQLGSVQVEFKYNPGATTDTVGIAYQAIGY